MGLLKKIKKAASAVEDKAVSAAEVVSRVPKAAKVFGSELNKNVRSELNDPTSGGYSFAHSPAGQGYLPGPLKTALGFVLPTPAETVNSNREFIKHPGLKTGLRAGLADVSIATAPALVSGVARAPMAAKAGASQIAKRGLLTTLNSESGAARVVGGIAAKKTITEVAEEGAKVQAAKAVTAAAGKTERVASKIGGERVAATAMADEAADVAKSARLQHIPDNLLSEMRTPGAKLERVRRLNAKPGAAGGRTLAATSPEAIKTAGIEPAKAPRSRIAGATTTANRPSQGGLRAASTAPPVAEEVAQHAATAVFQKMPDVALNRMAEQGVSGAQLESARRAAAALKPKPAFGTNVPPPTPLSPSQAEVLNAAKPKAAPAVSTASKSGSGLGMPSAAERKATAAQVTAEAPKPKKPAPRGSNANYNAKNGKVTKRAITNEDLAKLPGGSAHPEVPPATAPRRAPGGSIKGAPRGAAVRREPTAALNEALASAGEGPATTTAARGIRAKASKPVAEAAPKPEPAPVATAPAPAAEPKAVKTPAASKAPKAATPEPAGERATLDTELTAAQSTARRSVFSRVKGAGRFGLKSTKIAAEITLPLAAGGALLANRGGGGAEPAAIENATPTVPAGVSGAKSTGPGPDEIGLRAVAEVAKKKGKRGTQALMTGLRNTKAANNLSGAQYDSYLREAVRRAFEANQ